MRLKDFNYHLPDALIARYPLPERTQSRLLVIDKNRKKLLHAQFSQIDNWLNPGDLIIANDTKVFPARLQGFKDTGGKVEVLIERILDDKKIIALVRASKSPKSGSKVYLKEHCLEVLGRKGEHYSLSAVGCSIYEIITQHGKIPIPPYFSREPESIDEERYQTIYAKQKGSVAAPTAGFHFDASLFEKLKQKQILVEFLTLHVGSGTFAPVREADIQKHQMHSEFVNVSQTLCEKIKITKQNGGRIIAVGTTTARSLETACLSGELKPFCGETNIFIYPGFEFRCIDGLITNFHLPCSTLLMLVSALAGHELIMQAYQVAVEQKYRFFSYGDAMFINCA